MIINLYELDGCTPTAGSVANINGRIYKDSPSFVGIQSFSFLTIASTNSINKSSYNTSSDPRSLINLNKGDTIVDPILNKIQVISKDFCDNVLRISIKSKSGQYTFSFKRV